MYQTYLRQKTFKISTKSSDVAYLPPLWRQASLLNGGSCTLTYPVVKDPRARGTSLGMCKGVASQCRKSDLFISIFGSISRFKHNHHVPCRHWTAVNTRSPLWRWELQLYTGETPITQWHKVYIYIHLLLTWHQYQVHNSTIKQNNRCHQPFMGL